MAHHLANQIVDRRKYFDRWPHKLLQPKFMQDAFEPVHKILYGRILPEDLVKARCAIFQISLYPVDMAEKVASTNAHVPEDLLNLAEDIRCGGKGSRNRLSVCASLQAR